MARASQEVRDHRTQSGNGVARAEQTAKAPSPVSGYGLDFFNGVLC